MIDPLTETMIDPVIDPNINRIEPLFRAMIDPVIDGKKIPRIDPRIDPRIEGNLFRAGGSKYDIQLRAGGMEKNSRTAVVVDRNIDN